MAVSKDMGASQVITVEKIEERLKLAKDFGADHLISLNKYSSAEERVDRIKEITGGRGVDPVMELTGGQQGIAEGIKMLTPGGTYLLIGMISGKITFEGGIDPREFVFQGKKFLGSANYRPWTIPKVSDFLVRTKDKYPFDKLISHKFPLEKINDAMKIAIEGKTARAAVVRQLK
jgi:threonine dehydrogenase-like Zn-dependent dehydrogenase